MKTTVSISFFFICTKGFEARRRRLKREGVAVEPLPTDPGLIECRITVRKLRAEMVTGIKNITRQQWDDEAKQVRGKGLAVTTANGVLTKMRDQLNDLHADLERQGKPVTAARLKALYRDNGSVLSLLDLNTAFLLERESMVGLALAPRTLLGNQVRFRRLEKFLKVHSLTDLRPEEFTNNMADKMHRWLRQMQDYKHDSAVKVLQNVSQVLTWGVQRELLEKNPLDTYKFTRSAPKDITYLGADEVELLTGYRFASQALGRVRDLFIFQCWTGLAYVDLMALNVKRDVETAPNGRRVLRIRRAKSTLFKGYECVIPLLPEAERILALYDERLPKISNAVYNRYLKQVGELVGIAAEKMTSHVGRKTAGTLMLNKGIPMEAVSKFLGHSNVTITQKLYAKLLDTTVLDAFDSVFGGPPTGNGPAEAEETGGRVVQMRFVA